MGELIDETIRIHWELDWPDQVVVDERHRAFFKGVKLSITQALPKVEQIEFAVLDLDEDNYGH